MSEFRDTRVTVRVLHCQLTLQLEVLEFKSLILGLVLLQLGKLLFDLLLLLLKFQGHILVILLHFCLDLLHDPVDLFSGFGPVLQNLWDNILAKLFTGGGGTAGALGHMELLKSTYLLNQLF